MSEMPDKTWPDRIWVTARHVTKDGEVTSGSFNFHEARMDAKLYLRADKLPRCRTCKRATPIKYVKRSVYCDYHDAYFGQFDGCIHHSELESL